MRRFAMAGLLGALAFALALPGGASAAPKHVRVKSFDGTELDGWLRLPKLAHGARAPVVLWSGPYFGQIQDSGDSASYDNADTYVPVKSLVERGYAVAIFNVRGTGNSGGCFTFLGPDEKRDQAVLVNWLARRSWSTGRVGMMGASYDGTTPLEAAIQAPAALKTIVAEGPVSNVATGLEFTPQGAEWTSVEPQWPAYDVLVSLLPPLVGDGAAAQAVQSHPSPDSRICPDVASVLTGGSTGPGADERDEAFYAERDFLAHFDRIRASVLWVQGYYDDEYFSDDTIWPALKNPPKRYITGPFPHTAPDAIVPGWSKTLAAWFDYWLKGIGPRPAHLDEATWGEARDPGVPPAVYPTGPWHHSRAWPPPEAREQVLYLAPDALRAKPSAASASYQSLPSAEGLNGPMLGPGGYYWPKAFACQGSGAGRLLYTTAPLTKSVTVAGNPLVDLHATVDQPGGIVTVNLLDLAGDPCQSATQLSFGAADLRFAHGNWKAAPPPTGKPFRLRVDLTATGHVVPAGHRLAVLVSYGPLLDHTAPYLPSVTLAGDSEVVVPLTAGTLGG